MKIQVEDREIRVPNHLVVEVIRELGLGLSDELKRLIAKVYEAGFRDPVEIAEVVREVIED